MTEEQERMLLDVYATVKKQAGEHIVMDTSKDDEGREFYVIRDGLGEPGKRVLFKIEKNLEQATQISAQSRLTAIRRMRIIKAVLMVGKEIEAHEQAFRSAT